MRREPDVTGSRLKAVPAEPKADIDIESSCEVEIPPIVTPGKYEVAFLRAERKANLWGRGRAFLHFRITEPGPFFGVTLFMSTTLPPAGRFSLSSKFLQQWSLAAGRRPARRDRLSTNVFRGKRFLAAVRTVVHDSAGLDREATWQYSVIDRLIEVRAGA